MVSFAGSSNNSSTNQSNALLNSRMHKRVPLSVTLFLRRLTNSVSYGKEVETVNVSQRGLLIRCDVALREGEPLEVNCF